MNIKVRSFKLEIQLCKSINIHYSLTTAASTQSSNWCPIQPALNHDSLTTDAGCPFCHSSGHSVHLPNRPAAVTPTTQPAPAQYTPLAPGAVNAQLHASVLARGTGMTAATMYRNQATDRGASQPKSPSTLLIHCQSCVSKVLSRK